MSEYIYEDLLNRPITENTKIFLPFDSTDSKFTNYGTESNLSITSNLTLVDNTHIDIGDGSLSIANNGWVKISNHNINLETQEYWTIQLSFYITSHKRQTVFAKVYEMEEGGYDSVVQLDLLPNGRGVFYHSYANYNSFDTVDIGSFDLNRMHKLALVRNGKSLKLFINGVCILQSCGMRDYGDGIPVNNFNGLYDITDAPFYLGSHPCCDADSTDAPTTFSGYIDNFRIDYEALWDSDYGIYSSEIGASVNIVSKSSSIVGATVFVTQFGEESIGSCISINPRSDINCSLCVCRILHACVYIIPKSDIGCSVNITSEGQKLYACVNISGSINEDIYSIVNVSSLLQSIGGNVNVCISKTSDIYASVFLVGGLSASVNVIKKDYNDINSSVFVCTKDYSDIGCSLFVPKDVDIKSSVLVLKYGSNDFRGKLITIADRPDSVVITSNIANNIWQESATANFEWDIPHDEMSVVDEYHVAFNDIPDYNITEEDQRINVNYISKTADYSGRWYLHVKAVNRLGNYSLLTSHYCIAFNHIPSDIPQDNLLVNYQERYNGAVAFPEFQWGRSSDADYLDYITYQLQISKDNFSTSLDYSVDDPIGENVLYQIPSPISVGQYKWRIRPYDGKQYGNWTQSQYPFDIVSQKEDIGAKVLIPIYSNVNFGAKVYIINYVNLNATVFVRKNGDSDIQSVLRVCRKSDFELGAMLNIRAYRDIGARVSLNYGSSLGCRVSVIKIPYSSNISSSVMVCHKFDSELRCSLNVKYKVVLSIGAGVYIIPYSNIGASLNIYNSTHFGYIEDFSRDIKATVMVSKSGYSNIYSKVNTAAIRPDALQVFCNVAGSTWQENNLITFTWTSLVNQRVEIDGYFTQIDKNPSTQPSENFQRTSGFTRSFNLEILSGAGIYYFHIAAKNIYGYWGPVTHFEIRYNHKPSEPSNLCINGNYSGRIPVLVSRYSGNTFEWDAGIDSDQLDSVVYNLQISTRYDFGKDDSGNETILLNSVNILQNHNIISMNYLNKNYYWRVRSYDGHEYSDWSEVGMFTANTPPTVPNKLSVI